MTPSFSEAMQAAKRVIDAGKLADIEDVIAMHTYQLSAELRRVPEHQRISRALQISRQIIANTRESLD